MMEEQENHKSSVLIDSVGELREDENLLHYFSVFFCFIWASLSPIWVELLGSGKKKEFKRVWSLNESSEAH